MPLVSHEDGDLRSLKPSHWRRVRCADDLVHQAFVRVLYFGTHSQYDFLCNLQQPIREEDIVEDDVTCMLCLSREQDMPLVERGFGVFNPTGTRTGRLSSKPRRSNRPRPR